MPEAEKCFGCRRLRTNDRKNGIAERKRSRFLVHHGKLWDEHRKSFRSSLSRKAGGFQRQRLWSPVATGEIPQRSSKRRKGFRKTLAGGRRPRSAGEMAAKPPEGDGAVSLLSAKHTIPQISVKSVFICAAGFSARRPSARPWPQGWLARRWGPRNSFPRSASCRTDPYRYQRSPATRCSKNRYRG